MSLALRACQIPFAVSLLAVACGGEANRPPVELDDTGGATGGGSEPDCCPAARAFGGPGRCADGDFELVEARHQLLEAIDGWPAGARNDEALLHLGALEWLRDEPEAAAVYFQRILKTYPASLYGLEACVNLGDLYFFNQGAFVPAREATTVRSTTSSSRGPRFPGLR